MIKLAVVLAFLLAPTLALGADKSEGPWKVETSALGTTVSNGTTSFRAKDAKAGQQMADELNKIAKKEERKNKGDNKKK